MRIEGGVHCWTDSISFPLLCVYDICDCANSSSPYLMANDFLLVLILLIMTPNYILMCIGGIRVGLSTLIFVANMGGIMIFFCKTVVAIQLTLLYKQVILLNNLLVLIKNIVTYRYANIPCSSQKQHIYCHSNLPSTTLVIRRLAFAYKSKVYVYQTVFKKHSLGNTTT